MATARQRLVAINTIKRAHRAIVRLVAGWQREGVDTKPLAEPMLRIQEALAVLAAPDTLARKK